MHQFSVVFLKKSSRTFWPASRGTGWFIHLVHRCRPGILHDQPRGMRCLPPVFLFPGLCSVTVEHTSPSGSWEKSHGMLIFLTLPLWTCLFPPHPVRLGVELQVGSYFPPENWKVLLFRLLASSTAVRRRKLFSFFIFFQSGILENLLLVPRVMTFHDDVSWRGSIFVYCAGPSVSPWNLESWSLDLWTFLELFYWWSPYIFLYSF